MWLPLAIFAALGTSATTLIAKKLTHNIHPVIFLFFCNLITLPFMLGILLFLGGIPEFTTRFIFLLISVSILDLIAFIAAIWAIKYSPVSLLSPISAFTPVFATLFGFLILAESPTPIKLLGILTVVIGTYFLNISDVREGVLKPIKKLFSDKGVRLYLIQTIIFGVTPILQKQAIFETNPNSPLFVSFFGNSLVVMALLGYTFYKLRGTQLNSISTQSNIMWLFFFGVINAFTQFAAFTVFSLTNVGYATAVFNLAVLFTILMGGFFLKEKKIKERLLGAIIMILGTVLIAL